MFIGHFYPFSQNPPKNGVKSALNNISKCLTSVDLARFLQKRFFGMTLGAFWRADLLCNFFSGIHRAKEHFCATTRFEVMGGF